MSPDEVLQITADEMSRVTVTLQALGVPEVPGLLVLLNATLRRLLRAGVSPDLVLQMVQDSFGIIQRHGY